MSTNDYLQRLKSQLKGFSPDEQGQLIEEIAAHIEAGEKDPGLGQNETARAKRLERELGSPDELGRRLRQIHRPRPWLDFFLVALPAVLIFPLLPLIATWISALPAPATQAESLVWISIRLGICVRAGLVLVGRWKASPGVLIYWLASILLAIIGVLLSEIRWPWLPVEFWTKSMISLPEAIFWLTAFAILLVWLVRVVYGHRSEPLLVILAVTPFLLAVANYVAWLTVFYYLPYNWTFSMPKIGWFGVDQVVGIIWSALFFLPRQRNLRWAGLLLLPVPAMIYFLWPLHIYPLVVTLNLLPFGLVLVAWTRDIRARLIPTVR